MPLIILIAIAVLLVSGDAQNTDCISCKDLIPAAELQAIKDSAVIQAIQPMEKELDSLERVKKELQYEYKRLCRTTYKVRRIDTVKSVRGTELWLWRYKKEPGQPWQYVSTLIKKL